MRFVENGDNIYRRIIYTAINDLHGQAILPNLGVFGCRLLCVHHVTAVVRIASLENACPESTYILVPGDIHFALLRMYV